MTARTLGDHIDETRSKVYGPNGSEPEMHWHTRLKALVVDGKSLGSLELVPDKETAKRIDEIQGLGYALVGANVDHEIVEIRSLPTRHDVATPDFEATIIDGRTIRIETCALVDSSERLALNVHNAIHKRVIERLNAGTNPTTKFGTRGRFMVRFYGEEPTPRDIPAASAELFDLIDKHGPTLGSSRSAPKVPAQFTTLSRLGAVWCRDNDEPLSLQVQPLRVKRGAVRPADSFGSLFAKKAAKVAAYSDVGTVPTWLAMYVNSWTCIAMGDVQKIIDRNPSFDPAPFERLLVGSLTCGHTWVSSMTTP